MIPVNPPAPGNLNGINWVIQLFCFIVFFLAVAAVKLPGSSVDEGQILTEAFVYSSTAYSDFKTSF